MSKQILLLDRVEFTEISIRPNVGEFPLDESFPQLAASPTGPKFLTRTELFYSDEELDDPRIFVLAYGLKVDPEPAAPYTFQIDTMGYFRYVGQQSDDYDGEQRFRAVRQSGYQILHGAIREMIANLTARSRNGMWHLPARNFNALAHRESIQDEKDRQELLRRLEGADTPESTSAVAPPLEKKMRKKPVKRSPE